MYFDDPKFPVHSYLILLIDAPESLKKNKKFVRFLRNIVQETIRFDSNSNPNQDFNGEYPTCISLTFFAREEDFQKLYNRFNLWKKLFDTDPQNNLAKLMIVELDQSHKINSVWEIDKAFPATIGALRQHANDELAMFEVELYCSLNPVKT